MNVIGIVSLERGIIYTNDMGLLLVLVVGDVLLLVCQILRIPVILLMSFLRWVVKAIQSDFSSRKR